MHSTALGPLTLHWQRALQALGYRFRAFVPSGKVCLQSLRRLRLPLRRSHAQVFVGLSKKLKSSLSWQLVTEDCILYMPPSLWPTTYSSPLSLTPKELISTCRLISMRVSDDQDLLVGSSVAIHINHCNSHHRHIFPSSTPAALFPSTSIPSNNRAVS